MFFIKEYAVNSLSKRVVVLVAVLSISAFVQEHGDKLEVGKKKVFVSQSEIEGCLVAPYYSDEDGDDEEVVFLASVCQNTENEYA